MPMTIELPKVIVKMEGTVTAPPTLEAIQKRLEAAYLAKQPVELTPGEARVLADHLEATK